MLLEGILKEATSYYPWHVAHKVYHHSYQMINTICMFWQENKTGFYLKQGSCFTAYAQYITIYSIISGEWE